MCEVCIGGLALPLQLIVLSGFLSTLNVKEKELISFTSISYFFPSLLSLSLPRPGCLSVGTPGWRRRLAGGQTSLITSFFPLHLSVHPVRWDRGSNADIYLLTYGVRSQTGKWFLFFFVCFVSAWEGRCAPDYNFVACLLLDASAFEVTGSTLHLKHVSRYKQEKRILLSPITVSNMAFYRL